MDRIFHLLIDGAAVAGANMFDVINPATGQPFATCPKADHAMLEAAVSAAQRAFTTWSQTPLPERADLLRQLSDQLEARSDEFVRLLTAEQGKPLLQAEREIMGSVGVLRVFAGMRLEPRVLRDDGSKRVVEHRKALGVVAAMTPWNFPIMLLMNKLAPALLAGNTIVVKPAPTTPLTTLLFGELCREILPPGVVNILCDENELGTALTSHPGIAKISFTGSTATGQKVMAAAAQGIKRVTLELGGNDAAIVLDDVDPVGAARKVFMGAMANSGQICVATKRAYVPEALYDAFCDELGELARNAIIDDGAAQGAQMGPVQNEAQFDRIKDLIEDSRLHGTIVAGGEALDRPGYFMPPTIVRDVPDDARIVREEQFGPILPVLKYSTIDEVVARVNASDLGLAGTVWGEDVARATEVAMRIESGTVWVNHAFGLDPTIAFRGTKQSGLGAELGEEGLHEYTQAHVVSAIALAY